MIITNILRNDDAVHLCTAKGEAVILSYAAWQDFLAARGAVSMPFNLDLRSTNAVDIFTRHQKVIISDAESIR